MGLIAHPIAGYNPTKVKEILKVPVNYVLITIIIVARPGDPAILSEDHRIIELGERDRKPLVEVMTRNRFISELEKD